MTLEGRCDRRFDAVARELRRNLTERGLLGASVCVVWQGRTVVDLWGGFVDPEMTAPWARDTVTMVWSCTKGATALCAHLLVDRGELDLDRPVAHYWPEYAANGKRETTVRMILSHQAGLPGFPGEPPDPCDWHAATAALANAPPYWEPGAAYGYHAMTFGWLAGEVIRRVSGETPGALLAREITGPLGLELWLGLPEEIEPRVAPTIVTDMGDGPAIGPALDPARARLRRRTHSALMRSLERLVDPACCNSRRVRACEIPAVNAIGNARGLAGLYVPLASGGAVGDRVVVREATLADMAAVESAGPEDVVTGEPSRFSTGFEKTAGAPVSPSGVLASLVLSEDAFGHTGWGGSLGFADPAAELAFGYAVNRHGTGSTHYQVLVDAVYAALGYRRVAARWTPSARSTPVG